MSTEALNGTSYWREIHDGLFVHNKDWNRTIERLPGILSAEEALSKLQTIEQLLDCGMQGRGVIGTSYVEVQPQKEILLNDGLLQEDIFSVENLFLQWMYQFTIVESISSHFASTPIFEWNKTFIDMINDSLHAMTYIAAIIFIYEEGGFKSLVTRENFSTTQISVVEKVEELTSTLYAKCAEYGESFRRQSLPGTLPRLWDKIARYARLSALGRSATYEPKLDSAKDLLGYCIISWSLVQELND